ncbi:HD domain-containing phosphohydrolase [Clostridium sp. C2-6-12]|uniref:diguanylate cyclase n=1 Tax=Clostridium sp. C2-6-12 TaxID=2698832 RepID=UPI00136FAF7C|nr:HD domain-containing phosphohydrolase [Clostridium sp. C2-6-12]
MFEVIKRKISSALNFESENNLIYENVKICLIYLIIGFVWILFSDRIANSIAKNNEMLLKINTYKGWLYVIITSIILYLLTKSFINKVEAAEKKLQESYEELTAANEELQAYVQQLTASEQELRNHYDKVIESEEKYKSLVNEMNQGLAIYEAIPNEKGEFTDYKFIYANKGHEEMTGLKNEGLADRLVSEIFPSIEADILDKFSEVVKTGKPYGYENHLSETERDYAVIAYRPKQGQLAVIVTDITEKKKAEDALRTSEYNFRNIFEASSDGILIVSNYEVIDCNLALVDLFGYDSKANILGKTLIELSPTKQPDGELSEEKISKIYNDVARNGNYKYEWWYKRIDGKILPVEIVMTNILLNGRIVFHSLWRDISERKQMERKMEYLSYHDQLTGLYNRRFFEEELLRLDVKRNLPLTIIMADVNGLKLVNDSFGHTVGDNLLIKVAEVMTSGCRCDDVIARLGGDEFVILLPKTDKHEAGEIVKRIKERALNQKVESVEISISFGFETKKSSTEKIDDILKKADDHMYENKLLESQSMRWKTINAIIATLNGKDKREEQGYYNISNYCKSLGMAVGLSKEDLNELKSISLLRDIGKISIDEKIFSKPGKLTEEEWEEVRRHPEIGYRILCTVTSMTQIAEYVLAHHERWDGTGYPKGLRGEEIPLKSRILAIADSYNAMLSERSFRSPLTEEEALEELKINAGSQFDPTLVKVFVEEVLNKSFN